jgi:hypothetical protein
VTGMRERAALAGGHLVVEPAEPAGTAVRATLPARRRAARVAPPRRARPQARSETGAR